MKFINVNSQQELEFQDTLIPEIAADECLIKVKCIGVNRADILQRAGKYPAPVGESDILGLEVCGDIVKLGSNVSNFKLEQKIFGLVAGGGYAEYVKIKAAHIMLLPSSFSYEQGAAIAEVYLTAFQSLFTIAQLKPKQNILIHAGASGVGTAAIQLAKSIDAIVTVTVSSERKALACESLGADNIINYHEQDFVVWKKQYLVSGFDVILDVVGGDYLSRNIDAAALDARVVMLAMLQGRFCEKVDIAKMLMKRINIHASTLRNRSDDYKTTLVLDFVEQCYDLLAAGQLTPVIEKVLSWQNANEAHQLMAANTNIGKYILNVD